MATSGGKAWEPPPAHLIDWQGKDWTPEDGKAGRKAAHPNARFTVAAAQCPVDRRRLGRPERRSDRCIPLRWPTFDHGAARYRGAQLGRGRLHGGDDGLRNHGRGGRRTGRAPARPVRDAAVLRLQHGRSLRSLDHAGPRTAGRRARTLPRIFTVNWFRTDADGKFVWPGFGENMRVLQWIIDRIDGRADGAEHVFGVTPRYEDLKWNGLEFPRDRYEQITAIDAADWRKEIASHAELFDKLKPHLPGELEQTRASMARRVAGLKPLLGGAPDGPLWRPVVHLPGDVLQLRRLAGADILPVCPGPPASGRGRLRSPSWASSTTSRRCSSTSAPSGWRGPSVSAAAFVVR